MPSIVSRRWRDSLACEGRKTVTMAVCDVIASGIEFFEGGLEEHESKHGVVKRGLEGKGESRAASGNALVWRMVETHKPVTSHSELQAVGQGDEDGSVKEGGIYRGTRPKRKNVP